MDCRVVQEWILDSLAEGRLGTNAPDVEIHLAGCTECRHFSEIQFMLDRQLNATISTPHVSQVFRASLMKRIRREPLSVWPGYLPDVAHLAGCFCATALSLIALPFPAGPVVLVALGFTFVTYVVQSTIRGSLEAWEERR